MQLIIRISIILSLWICLTATSTLFAADDSTLMSLEVHGNFHSGGIVAAIAGDGNRDASVSLEWRPQGQGHFDPDIP